MKEYKLERLKEIKTNCWNFNLMMLGLGLVLKSQGVNYLFNVYLYLLKYCIKYLVNAKHTTICNAHRQPHGGARRKIKRYLKSAGIIPWGPWMSAQSFMVVHVKVVDIFSLDQSGGRLTDIAIHAASLS